MELTQYGIEYALRTSIKAQAFADFIVECSAHPVESSLVEGPEAAKWWEIHTDGAASTRHCGGGVMVTTPEGFRLYYALRYQFRTSNNEAEEERLRLYKDVVKGLLNKLEAYEIVHISRAENAEADILSKLALGRVPLYLSMACRIAVVERPSTEMLSVCAVVQAPTSLPSHDNQPKWPWLTDLIRYKQKAELPDNKEDADCIRRRAPSFELVDGLLYKRSDGRPLLCSLLPEEARTVMAATHRGICEAPQGDNTLAKKLIVRGYYWPTMVKDCVEEVLKCSVCQVFAKKSTRPATFYTPITTAIPFVSGVSTYSGRCPKCPGEFGLPEQLVTDNGRQFDNRAFATFCVQNGIRHIKVSVAYHQANGQIENLNRTLLDGLWKKLEELGDTWVEQLEKVLWAYRTTPRRETVETPIALAYRFEAKVPTELLVPSRRVLLYNDEGNEGTLRIEKNLLEERRDVAYARMVEYQKAVKRYQEGEPVERMWNTHHLKKFYQ
ncbi:PREDICTED: uncharacterized protein LOC109179780 [Ipomoea nil]|uniref:uncharacterized protein LOC109179780 n=1 Tax=Ipomoea nil TaxID=35883 RepID=UPI00090181EE|nr:PREDICTED: uncharacterized protein LOC109179780 [Ipomoea nil]